MYCNRIVRWDKRKFETGRMTFKNKSKQNLEEQYGNDLNVCDGYYENDDEKGEKDD